MYQGDFSLNDILLESSSNGLMFIGNPEFSIGNLLGARESNGIVSASGYISDVRVHLESYCSEKEFMRFQSEPLRYSISEVLSNSFRSLYDSDQKMVKLCARKRGDIYEVVLEDSGRGIERERMSYIGSAGYTPENNNGFALFLTRQMLQSYGGELVIESNGLRNSGAESLSIQEIDERLCTALFSRLDQRSKKVVLSPANIGSSDVVKGTKITMTFRPIYY